MNEVVAIILGTGEKNVNQRESTQRHYVVLQRWWLQVYESHLVNVFKTF
jgi:hypothetical protein